MGYYLGAAQQNPTLKGSLRNKKKIIRIMKKVYYLASCKELFVELRILTVPSLVIKHICSHVKKNIDTFLEQGTHSEYNL